MSDPEKKPKKLLHNPLTSLKHKSFRYYWTAQSVSLIGTWMQNISLPVLAYSITKSALLLSIVGVVQYGPMLLFSLFAGALIDKFPKKNILLITQSILMIVSFAFFILIITDSVQYWHILLLALLIGFANTFDMPTRQSFLIELVGKPDLMNAIGLNSAMFNVARILGPSVAGILIDSVGTGFCFMINGFSFIGIIIVLIFIKPQFIDSVEKTIKTTIVTDIKDGLVYILKNNALFFSLFLIAVIGTFAINFNVLVPVFSDEILHQKESGFGFLMAAMGIGSLVGAIMIAARSKHGPNKIVLIFWPFLIAAALIITGFTSVTFNTTANTNIQHNSENIFRSRVMSVFTLFMAGTTPIGNFFCGVIMYSLGARAAFISCGLVIVCIVAALYIIKKTFLKAYLKKQTS